MRLDSAPGRWLLAVAVLGSGIAFLDATVVNVALPDIGRDLHASTSTLQWILNGYVLTLAALILLGGSLGDRYGRRRIFVLGTGVFTIASLLCAVAPNAELLVVARLVQGVGGALLTPGSLAMVESGFRPADRARAIGAWSGLGGVAGALGPLVGGLLVGAVSWRAVFLINLPLGMFIVVMAGRHVPETRDPAAGGRLDYRGVILAAVGLAGTTYALIEAPAHGASILVLVMAIAGGLALIAFLLSEQGAANPMMPLSMFSSRQFSAANAVTFVVFGAFSGVFFLLVAFLQISLGYSPLAAGAASLPITALMLVLSAPAGGLAQRIGPKIPLTVGPLVTALGLLLLSRIDPGDSYLSAVRQNCGPAPRATRAAASSRMLERAMTGGASSRGVSPAPRRSARRSISSMSRRTAATALTGTDHKRSTASSRCTPRRVTHQIPCGNSTAPSIC